MAEFNLLEKTADERRSELYGLAPYLVYKVGDRTYNYGAKAAAALFYNGALKDVNPTEILSIGADVKTLYFCFRGKASIVKIHCEDWDTRSVSSLDSAFFGVGAKEIPCSNWDTSSVTTAVRTFTTSNIEKLDIGNWNTSRLTTALNMFDGCLVLRQLRMFAIPSGCITTYMFSNCRALTDVRCGGLIYPSLSFASCPLTAESVIDILEHLADTPDEGATITFKAGTYAGFTSAEREVIDALVSAAVANGWTIVNMSAA